MAGLTQPLEFRKHLLCRPRRGFDIVPFLDAFLIVLFVSLNTSAFIMAPGTAVQLPFSRAMEPSRDLPTAVLTVDRNELYFFEGRKLAAVALEDRLRDFIEDDGEMTRSSGAVLLIKADATITSDVLFGLMDTARQVGFSEVHLAAEPASRGSSPWGDRSPEPNP
ncbi:MAG: ExbD/TolR family protein [Puniceicoccaceae bacterium]